MATLRLAADAAAYCATLGMLHALEGERPEVVAARAVRAIAVAISTSRSYAAFVAAAAAAESVASICAEDPVGCGDWPPELVAHRVRNDAHNALDNAMDPDAAFHAWPLIFDDDEFHLSVSRRSSPFPTGGFGSFKPSPARQNAVLDMATKFFMINH